jgi:hypothetical protein
MDWATACILEALAVTLVLDLIWIGIYKLTAKEKKRRA